MPRFLDLLCGSPAERCDSERRGFFYSPHHDYHRKALIVVGIVFGAPAAIGLYARAALRAGESAGAVGATIIAAIAAVGIVCTVAAFALERWAKRRGIQL